MRKSAKNQNSNFKHFLIMAKTKKEAQTLNAVEPQIQPAKADDIFTLVKDKDGIKIAVGNYQISRKVFKSWQAAEDYLNQKPYEIIINMACLFAEKTVKK